MNKEEKYPFQEIDNEIHDYNLRISQVFEERDKLRQENQKYKEVIDKAINDIDLVIELIKQQPTEDDSWILSRLNAFKIILKEVE